MLLLLLSLLVLLLLLLLLLLVAVVVVVVVVVVVSAAVMTVSSMLSFSPVRGSYITSSSSTSALVVFAVALVAVAVVVVALVAVVVEAVIFVMRGGVETRSARGKGSSLQCSRGLSTSKRSRCSYTQHGANVSRARQSAENTSYSIHIAFVEHEVSIVRVSRFHESTRHARRVCSMM
jgi:uncharacterized low-complexity protein